MDRRVVAIASGAAAAGLTTYYLYRFSQTRKNEKTQVSVKKHRPIYVWYGSQTGTSESFARDIVEEGRSEYGLDESVLTDAVSLESVSNQFDDLFFPNSGVEEERIVVILILSTYGEGDPSDDAVGFREWIEQESTQSLAHVDFAVFGCGNRQYALFNEMAKRTEKRLLQLGARRMCETGLGDDNADIELDFTNWKSSELWLKGMKLSPLNRSGSRNPAQRLVLDMQVAEKRSRLKFDACVLSSGNDVLSKFFFSANQVPVVGVTHICDSKTQIDLDISKVPCLRYRSGDTLEVLPRNRDIEFLLSLYKLNGNDLMSFSKKKTTKLLTVKKPFPTPVGLRYALEHYIDLHGIPSRSLIRDLCCVFGHRESEILEERESALNGAKVYTVEMVLKRLLSVTGPIVPLGDLIQLLPKQKSRGYSICSSPLEDAKRISLIVSKVDDHALASSYLSDTVAVNDLVAVSLRQGTFRLPSLPGTPVIMIGAGTGVAPFRAFIVELGLKNRCSSGYLFFGCRRESEWIYKSEMEHFANGGGHLHIAYSREGSNKCYVQNLLVERASELKPLIEERNAVVYVCGSTKMGLDVMDVFNNVVGIDVGKLRDLKQYYEELWG